MKLGSLFSTVATMVGGPGVGAAIKLATTAVNMFKAPKDQLPDDASQQDVEAAYDALEPSAKAAVVAKLETQLGMEKEKTAQIQALAIADAAGPGASTRPEIAAQMSTLLIFETLAFTVFLFWVLGTEGVEGLVSLAGLWVVFGTLTATPVAIIMTYFNARKTEKRTRYAVAHGQSANLSAIGSLVSAFRK